MRGQRDLPGEAGAVRWVALGVAKTVLESFTAVVEYSEREWATRAVESRSEWRKATALLLDEENRCRPEVRMLSCMDVSCIADSSIGESLSFLPWLRCV